MEFVRVIFVSDRSAHVHLVPAPPPSWGPIQPAKYWMRCTFEAGVSFCSF